mgnify:CR=1 FL=1
MRRLPITLGTLALAVALSITGAHAQETAPLRTQMSAEEFRAAGLDKLSATELAALERWIATRNAGTATVGSAPVSTDADALERIREQAREEGRQEVVQKNRGFLDFGSDEPIESVLPGQFTGLAKGRQYTLANGQVWEQVDAARLDGARRSDAEVSIRPGLLGAWYMRIKGFNTAAKVRRIK